MVLQKATNQGKEVSMRLWELDLCWYAHPGNARRWMTINLWLWWHTWRYVEFDPINVVTVDDNVRHQRMNAETQIYVPTALPHWVRIQLQLKRPYQVLISREYKSNWNADFNSEYKSHSNAQCNAVFVSKWYEQHDFQISHCLKLGDP